MKNRAPKIAIVKAAERNKNKNRRPELFITPLFGSRIFKLWPGTAVLICSLFSFCASAAQRLSDDDLTQIRFDQKLNTQVSVALPFRDETGREIRLGQYFGQKPAVLVLGYYECPMLCTLVLNGLLESAADMKWTVGREFEVIDVSVNPHEMPALAAAKKRAYIKRYGRSIGGQGWHFLTGSEPAIQQLTSEVGFHYAYDPESKEYAHPSGLIILTPAGKVSGYLFGVNYPSKDLYESLLRASASQVSSPIQQFILLCFHYNPITGKYSRLIIVLLRCLAVTTLLGMVWFIVLLVRRAGNPPGLLATNSSLVTNSSGPAVTTASPHSDPPQSPGIITGITSRSPHS